MRATRPWTTASVVGLCAAGAAALAACGRPQASTPETSRVPVTDRTVTATAAVSVTTDDDRADVQPLERLDAYLGNDRSAQGWYVLAVEAEQVMVACMAEAGIRYQAQSLDWLAWEASVEVPRARTDEGYGVADQLELDMARAEDRRTRPTAAPGDDDVSPSDPAYIEAMFGSESSPGCVGRVDEFYAPYMAPKPVHKRFNALFEAAAHDPRWVEASANWELCMASAGYADADAWAPGALVWDELYAEGMVPVPSESDISEDPVILTSQQLDAVRSIEAKVFAADTRCNDETGLDTVMLAIESDILDMLRDEFPDFAGVTAAD